MGLSLTWQGPQGPVTVQPRLVAAGLDFGFADPFALVVGAKVGPVWLMLDEIYETRLGIVETLRAVRGAVNQYRLARVWADAEDPKMIAYLASHNLPIVPNQIKDLDYGLRTVYGLLKIETPHPALGKGPRLRVNRGRCPSLSREFSRYAFPTVKGEVRTTTPIDRDNHALDALRYLLTNEGEMPPELAAAGPLDRPPMYVTPEGRWRDDPQATMARRMGAQTEPGGWWDEEEPGDPGFVLIDDTD